MSLVSPYRHGAYHYTVAALIAMGLNKTHKFAAFADRLQRVWQKADAEGWKDFKNRKARNKDTAKDLGGRILQNCRVLQRVKDYGRPLLVAGAVLDLTRDNGGNLQIRLNTKAKQPLKPGRAPAAKAAASAKPKSKSKPRSNRKPSKGKKRAGRAAVTAAATNQTDHAAADDAVKAEGTAESAKSE